MGCDYPGCTLTGEVEAGAEFPRGWMMIREGADSPYRAFCPEHRP